MTTATESAGATGATPLNPTGLAGVVGGVLAIVAAAYGITLDPDTGDFGPYMAITTVALAMILVAVVGLLRSEVPTTLTSKLGLRTAIAGFAILVVAHGVAVFDEDLGVAAFPLGQLVSALALVVAGTSLVRSGNWTGTKRFAPLLCGIYPFAVIAPSQAIHGDIWFPSLIGYGVVWAMCGLVISTVARHTQNPAPPTTRRTGRAVGRGREAT